MSTRPSRTLAGLPLAAALALTALTALTGAGVPASLERADASTQS